MGDPLPNHKWEKFAQLVAGGMDATDAYLAVYTNTKRASANTSAARLLANVRFRVQDLQRSSASDTVMDMRERREFFARVKRVDMMKLDTEKDGDLIQEVITTTTENGTSTKLKLPGKRECIMDDAKLAGELTDRVELSGAIKTTPADLLAAVRNSPALRGLPVNAPGNS